VREIAAGRTTRKGDSLDPVWKALSDPTRRTILDVLRDRPRTTTEIVERFSQLSRFGVMKHLEVLRQAQLVSTREAGRQRVNSLNVVPIRQIYERWVGPFQELWSGELLGIKDMAETESSGGRRRASRRRKKR
jgi:DNA-binding transcriptional ArsR family regulator